jgi:hypothetical protein
VKTAIHEAAHVIVARALGLVVERVSVEPVFDPHYRKWRAGTTEIKIVGDIARDFSPEMRERLRAEAVALLAGPAAERRAVSQKRSALRLSTLDEGSIDVARARWLLSRDTPPCDRAHVLRAAHATAERIVRKCWPAIEKLAARLTRERTLTWRS